MSENWFYNNESGVVGPVSLDDVANWIRTTKSGEYFVWREGMADWLDAKSMPEFQTLFPPFPPSRSENMPTQRLTTGLPPQPPLTSVRQVRRSDEMGRYDRLRAARSDFRADSPERMGPIGSRDEAPPPSINNHPWRRYFARMFDLYFFVLIAAVAIGIAFPNLFSGRTDDSSDSLFGLLIVALYIPVEGFFLFTFGTSFGKLLYGISLVSTNGHITLGEGLKRAAVVWLKGLGLGIPIVGLITLVVAYSSLKKENITSWDRDLGIQVKHASLSAFRWIGILTCWSMLTVLWGGLFYLGTQAN